MISHWLRAVALGGALFAALPAFADEAKGGDDPVVATVNGLPIHKSELMLAYQHSRLSQAPIEAVYPQLLDYVITGQLLLTEAKRANLSEDPEVKSEMRLAQDNILEQTYIERKVAAAVTDDAVKARYEEMIKAAPGKEEVHARHILLESEADAKQVIADLKGGAKFEDIAKAKSKDPSASQNGGDLGFFAKDEMVPEFSAAAFALKDGEVSSEPVKTQFGWHVIQVIERRTAPPPTLEESKSTIEDQLRKQAAQKVIEDLEKDASITRFNIDGTPIAAAPAAGEPKQPDSGEQKPADQKQ